MTDAILVLTACASMEEAGRIAAAALEQRLAACATITPEVRSRFWWQGKLDAATEVPLTFKTTRDCFAALAELIGRMHSYELPEILAVPVEEGSAAYLAWINEQTAGSKLLG
ncbi:MAG: divalent-cation tolerance protein CutA [Terriglobales bacterium]